MPPEITIPPQLQNPNFRFTPIPPHSKEPKLEKWGEIQRTFDDPILLEKIGKGFNYGVLGGYGFLLIIDADTKELENAVSVSLPTTFTVQTGSGKKHFYYLCKDLKNSIRLTKKTAGDIGDIRFKGGLVVGPNCIHPNGKPYIVEKALPISSITASQLKFAIRKFLPEIEEASEDTPQETLKISAIVDLESLTKKGDEYSGSHPVHGSESGCNFWVNPTKNVWRCFRCDSGGSFLSLIAVKEGIIRCDEAVPGKLRGSTFKKVLKVAQEKYGLKVNLPLEAEEIEPATHEGFSIKNLEEGFENTHKHLRLYPLINLETSLQGHSYYAVKKFLCYLLEASLQPAISFRIGGDYYDNRINGLVIASSGKGKGVIKNAVRRLRRFNAEEVQETSNVAHPQQLLGKKISDKMGNDIVEKPGLLAAKILIHDEAGEVINETDKYASEGMSIIRKAMDVFGLNLVEKKLVDNLSTYAFMPETQFLTFIHPQTLTAKFFDTGSFRRYFCFSLGTDENTDLDDCVKNMFSEEVQTEENKELMKALQNDLKSSRLMSLTFTEEAKKEIALWVTAWNAWVCNHPNQNIRVIGDKLFYSVKNYFVKLAAILSISLKKYEVPREVASIACFDCFQFLLHTLHNYTNHSEISLSSDVWGTGDSAEAMVLEWLHSKGATNPKESKVGIKLCQLAVGEFFGLSDRQSMRIYNKLKKRGLIGDKRGHPHDRVWLIRKPVISSIRIDLEEIIKKLQKNDPPIPILRLLFEAQENSSCQPNTSCQESPDCQKSPDCQESPDCQPNINPRKLPSRTFSPIHYYNALYANPQNSSSFLNIYKKYIEESVINGNLTPKWQLDKTEEIGDKEYLEVLKSSYLAPTIEKGAENGTEKGPKSPKKMIKKTTPAEGQNVLFSEGTEAENSEF